MKKKFIKILIFGIIFLSFSVCIKAEGYSNLDENDLLSCGGGYLTDIPSIIAKLTTIIYITIQVAVPILLVIFSSFDLIKAVTAGKDDEIKKNQKIVLKRFVMAILVFFVFTIVKLIISNISDSGIIECASCFLDYKNGCG